MNLKDFKEYLTEGIVRKISPNRRIEYSLIEYSNHIFLTKVIKNLKIIDDNANYIIEEIYDLIIGLIMAKMFIDCYAALGNYSHQAEVSYLKEINFS
ncbi:MAG: hypothetical protein QW622_02275 [Candidatus Pacearchaeota archaeon]